MVDTLVENEWTCKNEFVFYLQNENENEVWGLQKWDNSHRSWYVSCYKLVSGIESRDPSFLPLRTNKQTKDTADMQQNTYTGLNFWSGFTSILGIEVVWLFFLIPILYAPCIWNIYHNTFTIFLGESEGTTIPIPMEHFGMCSSQHLPRWPARWRCVRN